MRRRAMVCVAAMAATVLLAGGVALAANVIPCPGGLCEGTAGDDQMTGTNSTDYLYAKEGNDTLRGLGAFDDLRGGPGNDNLNGGGGNDQYNFYEDNWGRDLISADGAGTEDWLIFFTSGALTVDLIPSPDRPEVSSGPNRINFAPTVVIEWVQGGPASDSIKGNGAGNYILGGNLNDRLMGRGGNDKMYGDIAVFSNQGNDVLNGGPGRDILDGGPGDDTFYAQDGEADEIDCGPGGDVVHADPSLDALSNDCIDFVAP